jgi:hypothetical protein
MLNWSETLAIPAHPAASFKAPASFEESNAPVSTAIGRRVQVGKSYSTLISRDGQPMRISIPSGPQIPTS